MARAALQLEIRDVAKLAKVAPSTISRLEAGETLQPRTVEAIRRALEKAGVEFTNGNKPGVRLK
jgi:transcriptional regulator with XRE-family HTH domain